MTTPVVRSYVDFQFGGSVIFAKDFTSFPDNPRPGMTALKDGALWVYTTISGIQTWYPLTNKKSSFVHTQGVESFQWNVMHNLGTRDVIVGVFDESGMVAYPAVTIVDSNLIHLNFSSPATGRAIIFADGELFSPSVTAGALSIADGAVRIDVNGVLINGAYALTSANLDALVSSAVGSQLGTVTSQLGDIETALTAILAA